MSDEIHNALEQLKPKPDHVTDEQAAAALKKWSPGFDLETTRSQAMELFGKWQTEKGISGVLMATGIHNLAAAEQVQKHGKAIMEQEKAEPKIRLAGGMLVLEGCKASNEIINTLRELAKDAGLTLREPKPRNSPPDLQMNVQGEVHIHESSPPTLDT